ncbi:ATP-binding protein [Leptolyngbya ohadii]|uniref:ATP-binding protein n=1 Tax=Leptolyngbya ohadii TaxID=1962290 RepID=UPI000B5A16A2|nr:ATP-binding protein [Leptolyngbya ohadii]
MLDSTFASQPLIGRQAELQQISRILQDDGDLLLTGVPGSGRQRLIWSAAEQVGARVLRIDCMRATNAARFLELLAEGLLDVFSAPAELELIQRWSAGLPIVLESSLTRRARLTWHSSTDTQWELFQLLLSLPQAMAEWLDCRAVLVFQNFPHIRSWDKQRQWETYLQQEIQRQSRVSYALIATVPGDWVSDIPLPVITLGPLPPGELKPWVVEQMSQQGLDFEPEGHALNLFYSSVQGHPAGAMQLSRRLWLDSCALHPKGLLIQPHHVHRSTLALVEDLSVTFESLILLLPPSQVRVLESLALDPTDSPHARDYIKKHQLSRGGGLQGALAALEQKGLLYGAQYGYQIAMPFLTFWLKHRLA